jgi:uncharacterized RDD family membrane protein YckC
MMNEPSDPATNSATNPYTPPTSELTHIDNGGKPVLASLERRLFAAIIDMLIILAVTVVPLIYYFGGWQKYIQNVSEESFLFTTTMLALGFAVYLLIHGRLLANNGQTVGKKLLKIKIVRSDGTVADFQRIVVRRLLPTYLIQLVPAVGGLLALLDVLFIFRASRQCLHDQIADTIVINA